MNEQHERDRQDAGSTPASEGPPNPSDQKAGLDREVGDINDPDDDGALPSRMGGGLAGG